MSDKPYDFKREWINSFMENSALLRKHRPSDDLEAIVRDALAAHGWDMVESELPHQNCRVFNGLRRLDNAAVLIPFSFIELKQYTGPTLRSLVETRVRTMLRGACVRWGDLDKAMDAVSKKNKQLDTARALLRVLADAAPTEWLKLADDADAPDDHKIPDFTLTLGQARAARRLLEGEKEQVDDTAQTQVSRAD